VSRHSVENSSKLHDSETAARTQPDEVIEFDKILISQKQTMQQKRKAIVKA